MRMSEKCRNNNNNSNYRLTSRRTDRGKKKGMVVNKTLTVVL